MDRRSDSGRPGCVPRGTSTDRRGPDVPRGTSPPVPPPGPGPRAGRGAQGRGPRPVQPSRAAAQLAAPRRCAPARLGQCSRPCRTPPRRVAATDDGTSALRTALAERPAAPCGCGRCPPTRRRTSVSGFVPDVPPHRRAPSREPGAWRRPPAPRAGGAAPGTARRRPPQRRRGVPGRRDAPRDPGVEPTTVRAAGRAANPAASSAGSDPSPVPRGAASARSAARGPGAEHRPRRGAQLPGWIRSAGRSPMARAAGPAGGRPPPRRDHGPSRPTRHAPRAGACPPPDRPQGPDAANTAFARSAPERGSVNRSIVTSSRPLARPSSASARSSASRPSMATSRPPGAR